ncbi:MAG TPA: DUF3990 domain-containing protein [Anaerovoracaceae bacterium]|nr:DUF3990 domain-containing protein [Anaerovoracaceae bacterium]
MKKIKIYHGSQKIIERPVLGAGNPNNDYGLGFYCTESIELAKEWSCTDQADGYVNEYMLDMDDIDMLDLSDSQYHILNWLAILLANRTFKLEGSPAVLGREYIISTFMPEYKKYDAVKGYRADDSYFSFATSFLNNGISLSQLSDAMYLGDMGNQIVLRSDLAFDHLSYLGNTPADRKIYYPKRAARDESARRAFREARNDFKDDGVFLIDILRGRWQNDDPRIQRIILK